MTMEIKLSLLKLREKPLIDSMVVYKGWHDQTRAYLNFRDEPGLNRSWELMYLYMSSGEGDDPWNNTESRVDVNIHVCGYHNGEPKDFFFAAESRYTSLEFPDLEIEGSNDGYLLYPQEKEMIDVLKIVSTLRETLCEGDDDYHQYGPHEPFDKEKIVMIALKQKSLDEGASE